MKISGVVIGAVLMASATAAGAATTTGTFGETAIVNTGPSANPNVFQLTADDAPGYAGLQIRIDPISLSEINTLSLDYQILSGSIAEGSPRFIVYDTSNQYAFVYLGNGDGTYIDGNGGGFGNTGNYADLSDPNRRVEIGNFGGNTASQPLYTTWGDFSARFGGTQVSRVQFLVDNGGGNRQLLADNFTLNNTVFSVPDMAAVPEPASWAMMIIGFGLVGGGMRRRPKTRVSYA